MEMAAAHDKSDQDSLGPLASRLASLLNTQKPKKSVDAKSLLTALHALLDGSEAESGNARLALGMHLAQVNHRLLAVLPAVTDDPMLSTEQAARMIGCSRPYVAMLIDQGQLAGAAKSAGGHRKVPTSSVLAWIESHRTEGSADYREAARDAGMYQVQESAYVKAASRSGKRRRA